MLVKARDAAIHAARVGYGRTSGLAVMNVSAADIENAVAIWDRDVPPVLAFIETAAHAQYGGFTLGEAAPRYFDSAHAAAVHAARQQSRSAYSPSWNRAEMENQIRDEYRLALERLPNSKANAAADGFVGENEERDEAMYQERIAGKTWDQIWRARKDQFTLYTGARNAVERYAKRHDLPLPKQERKPRKK